MFATSDYQEEPTGRTVLFEGNTYHEMESAVRVAGPDLEPGRVLVEFAIAGPESNFAWARPQLYEPMWLDYEGSVGLAPGASVFGVDRDGDAGLTGTATPSCNAQPGPHYVVPRRRGGRRPLRDPRRIRDVAGGRALWVRHSDSPGQHRHRAGAHDDVLLA